MLKYALAIIAVVFSCLIYFITHSQSRPPEVDFSFAMVDSVKTIDPAAMSMIYEMEICQGLWEGLFSYNPEDSSPTEGVSYYPAEVSADYRNWTFHLRPDARWSNGDPVTASDFIFGWRRAIEPGTASDYAYLLRDNIVGMAEYVKWRNDAVQVLGILRELERGNQTSPENMAFLEAACLPGIKEINPNWHDIADIFRNKHLAEMEKMFAQVGINAPDDHTLTVELTGSLPYFEDLMAFATFSPIHKKSIEKLRISDDEVVNYYTLVVYDPQWLKSDYHKNGYPGLITNGPFKMSQWRFKDYMLFARNEYYWDIKNVACRNIMAKIMPESTASFLAYEKGKVDYLSNLTAMNFVPSLIEARKNGIRNDIHICDAWGTFYFQVNCSAKLNDGRDNPLNDKRVRMALNLSIDKQAIVDSVLRTGNTPATLVVPPSIIRGYSSTSGPSYNPEKAAELLAQAGYPHGNGLMAIELYYSTNGVYTRLCEAIAEMWEKNLNITVTLRGAEWKIFDADRQKNEFMICRAGWYGDYPDPTTFLDLFETNNTQNFCQFSNNEYDLLLKQAGQCPDRQKRLELLAQAEQIIIQEEMPIIPLYHYVNIEAFRPHLKGIYMNANQKHPFKYIIPEQTR